MSDDLERRIQEDLELAAVLQETLPTFRKRLEHMEETLNDCLELARVPVLTDEVKRTNNGA